MLSTTYKIYICILFGSFGLLTVLKRLELNGFQISLTFMNVIRETRIGHKNCFLLVIKQLKNHIIYTLITDMLVHDVPMCPYVIL